MIEMNELMKSIIDAENKIDISQDVEDIVKSIVRNTKLIEGCVIYDEEIDLIKVNFNFLMKFVGDLTGCEACYSEIRFTDGELPANQYMNFAKKLKEELINKYPGRKFAIIIFLHDGVVELKFHTYRENEGLWCGSDLSRFTDPILYCI